RDPTGASGAREHSWQATLSRARPAVRLRDKMRGVWYVMLAGVMLAAGACKKGRAGGPGGFGGGGPMGLPVEVAVARVDTVRDEIAATGQIEAVQSIDLRPEVDGRLAGLLRPGQEGTFRVAAIPGNDFSGTVDFVDPVVQLPGRTILVKARVPNSERLLQPGMFIEAHLVTAVRPKAIVIPEDA